MDQNKYTLLDDNDLSKINGGFWPAVVVGGWLAHEAYKHSDQIASGFSKGWKAVKH